MRISLSQAIALLKKGEVISVPTETVYGLAACLSKVSSIEQIFELKQRPRINPLITHLADWRGIQSYVTELPPQFEVLAKALWPGPLTLILPVGDAVPSSVRAGLPTAAFRVPSHPLTRDLIRETGPLVMPSANLSGRPSATRAEHVEEDFGVEFPVLDGGACLRGLESTILLYKDAEWGIVRLGALSAEQLQPILGYTPRFLEREEGKAPLSPGQLFRHYAPRARLLFGVEPSSFFILGFREREYPLGKRVIILGSLSSPEEVAENLYQALRLLDLENAEEAWVDMDFPREGLWVTIAERLMRAGWAVTNACSSRLSS